MSAANRVQLDEAGAGLDPGVAGKATGCATAGISGAWAAYPTQIPSLPSANGQLCWASQQTRDANPDYEHTAQHQRSAGAASQLPQASPKLTCSWDLRLHPQCCWLAASWLFTAQGKGSPPGPCSPPLRLSVLCPKVANLMHSRFVFAISDAPVAHTETCWRTGDRNKRVHATARYDHHFTFTKVANTLVSARRQPRHRGGHPGLE